MADALQTAGYHEFEDRRHEIEVQGCVMTTYVFEDWGPHEKVLWSSFRFDIRFARLLDTRKDGRKYMWAPSPSGTGISIVNVIMQPGTVARHELAKRRNPKPPHTPSPRTGLDEYVFKDSKDFVIIQLGHNSPEKPDLFATLFDRYRTEFCLPVS